MELLRTAGDYIWPRVCHVCGVRLPENEKYLCPVCVAQLPRTNYHHIPDNTMEQRFMGLFPYERATGHFFYSSGSNIASLIYDFKYHHFRGLARHMGRIMGRELVMSGFLTDIDVVVPVPMHFMKQARRGYNQSEQIAIGIESETGIKMLRGLKAVKRHHTQTSKTLQQRMNNVKGIFEVNNKIDLSGKGVVLVDDVCTTGSTLIEAAVTLTQAFPDMRLSLLTLAVTF